MEDFSMFLLQRFTNFDNWNGHCKSHVQMRRFGGDSDCTAVVIRFECQTWNSNLEQTLLSPSS